MAGAAYYVALNNNSPAATVPVTGEDVFYWTYRSPNVAATNGTNNRFGSYPAATGSSATFTSSSGLTNWFQVEASAIPEPTSIAVLTLAGGMLMRRSRRG